MSRIEKPPVDVVVCGLGWAGSLMSIELAKAGLRVHALEKGPDRDYDEFAYPKPADEYAYAVRNKVMTKPSDSAVTVRYTHHDVALPTRKWGAFVPGGGVGGSGMH